jgi:4-amino-4-deoxy-L-arabinose transferase-like glycosyltransferase
MNKRLAALAGRRPVWIAVLGVALALRLAVVATAPPVLLWPDGRFFEAIGWQLASEGSYGDQTIYAPAYPTLIAAVYEVAGRNLLALRIVEAVLSTAAVGLVGAFGAALFGAPAALVAAALAAVHPVLVVLPITHYAENLIVLLGALALGLFGLAVRRPSAARWGAAGIAFGLLALTKPNLLTLLPGLAAGAFLVMSRSALARIGYAALFLVALAGTVAPWIVRNHGVHDRWFAITTGGGRQFWLGNNPQATGATDRNPTPPPDLVRRLYAPGLTTVDREGVYYREAWRWVRENPGTAFGLYLAKMAALWAPVPRTATRNAYTMRWADWAAGLSSVVIFAGALMGLSRLGRFGAWYLPLAIASFTLVNSAFMMVMRYRMSFEVALLWMAGIGYAALLGEGRRGEVASPSREAA